MKEGLTLIAQAARTTHEMPAPVEEMEEAEALQQQLRREKMRQLQQDLDPCQIDEVSAAATSAPSVRQVGQFREERGQADRKRQERIRSAEARERRNLNYVGKKEISQVGRRIANSASNAIHCDRFCRR